MDKIHFGLKLFSNNKILNSKELIDSEYFDYIELAVLPDTHVETFKRLDVPIVIHVPNESFGVNIGDKKVKEYSLDMIQQSICFADKLNSEHIILHPGFGSEKDALDLLSDLDDKRIILENMTVKGLNGESCIGYDPDSLKRLANNRFGFCLDFGHAMKASLSLNRPYVDFLDSLLDLKPKMFHISDGDLAKDIDEHLNISEGQYDFLFFKRCVLKNPGRMVTVETPRTDYDSLSEPLQNVKRLRALWNMD